MFTLHADYSTVENVSASNAPCIHSYFRASKGAPAESGCSSIDAGPLDAGDSAFPRRGSTGRLR